MQGGEHQARGGHVGLPVVGRLHGNAGLDVHENTASFLFLQSLRGDEWR
jgi:hypothetical protein